MAENNKIYPEALAKDYAEGVLSVRQIAERYNLTVDEVQDYAFNHDLSHGSFGALVKRGVQMRAVYGGNGPVHKFPVTVDQEGVALVEEIKEHEVRGRHRYAIDSMFKLQELLTQGAIMEALSINDPARFHPGDARILAAKAMRGPKESIADQAKKLGELTKLVIELDLNNNKIAEAEKAGAGGTNIQVNVNGAGQNHTAIDERSKLAAVAGMLEMLKERRAAAINGDLICVKQ